MAQTIRNKLTGVIMTIPDTAALLAGWEPYDAGEQETDKKPKTSTRTTKAK